MSIRDTVTGVQHMERNTHEAECLLYIDLYRGICMVPFSL